ncbi:MAG TPA: hypothetical protein VK698_05745 [Kofleriaceae bacterium]|nr:hypothetical protein [Kofleriaceae bacterium]
MTARVVLGAALLAPLCVGQRTGAAQPPPAPAGKKKAEAPPPKSLAEQLEALRDDVDDLKDENEDLKADLADTKQQQAARKEPVRLNLMNPPITAFLNAAGRIDDRPVLSSGGTRIDDRMFLRTGEVDFRAAIDPYADGVLILAFEDLAGEGFEADIEEGYFVLKQLPILDAAPLGLKLKIGRYRAPIGNSNRLHMHDLPWTTRPLPITELLGTEQGDFFESGFNPEGIDAEFFLPDVIPGAVMELNADVVDGGDIAIGDPVDHPPGFLGHYNLFFTLGESHDFNLGLSGYVERGDHPSSLVAADFLYKWKPLEAGEFKSFVLGGELFQADRDFAVDTDGDGVADGESDSHPLAGYAFAQYQLTWHLYAGARYDYTEKVADDSLSTQVAAAYLSYYTSEFLRFRAGYEHRMSDIPAEDGVDSLLFEVNFVIGSHPIEPYWVNR